MADVRSSISDSGGTMHIASTRAAMDKMTEKVATVTGHMDRAQNIKSGFTSISNDENIALPAVSGSVLTEYSKMFQGVNSAMTDVLGRIQSSKTSEDILFHLPKIVSNTELVNNFVSKPFTGVSMPDPSSATSDILASSAAHADAVAALNGIPDHDVSGMVSAASVLLTEMQKAINGDSSGLSSAVAGLASVASSTKSNAQQVKSALDTFSNNSPVSSSLLSQFISGSIQSGMDIISSNLEQGKIGTGLFRIDESETTAADSAIKEIQQASVGIKDNNKLISLVTVQNRLVDDKRKHVYSAISFEEARQQALAQVDSLEDQYGDEIKNLLSQFGES
jgi:hypothetical protein